MKIGIGNSSERAQRLAGRKRILQARIAVRRMECVMAGAELARPVAFADRMWGHWQRLSPWVKLVGVPLGAFAARKFTRAPGGRGRLATLLRVLPVAVEAWKGFQEYRRGAKA